ncbi:MAG TPA: relaxase/mobilization nuclease domain-containing protein [Mucilaginibacter sp.]|jgi:hypothetical protein|nr:relaxase/mobilization nuclease domain-containing protein [Mucilaginibacter sp.]
MVVKILSASATFNGIKYNFEKLAAGAAELMAVRNFGPLQGMDQARQGDYKNYLQMLSARNKRVKQPQFHAVISAKGKSYSNKELTAIAEIWMAAMGYEKQPYMIFFHKDTDDNHVHIVSTRIDRDGKKISSEFEHVRAVGEMNRIMGLDEKEAIEKAMAYKFSTVAQFKMILESQGYILKGNNIIKFGKKLAEIDYEKLKFSEPDKHRIVQLKAIFHKYAKQYSTALKKDRDKFSSDFACYLRDKMGLTLVFHAKDDKPAYGYSIIDHAGKNVFKGSEIMSLKELLAIAATEIPEKEINTDPEKQAYYAALVNAAQHNYGDFEQGLHEQGLELGKQGETFVVYDRETDTYTAMPGIHITNDVDDEKTYGRKRDKKAKARSR